jgi:hypothetical protein
MILNPDEIERLLDLLREQRDATVSGERSGYGQARDQELADIDFLIEKIAR